ncbi:hypothetical protein EV177_009122, partial [Coemansia sp. RSA 1804]
MSVAETTDPTPKLENAVAGLSIDNSDSVPKDVVNEDDDEDNNSTDEGANDDSGAAKKKKKKNKNKKKKKTGAGASGQTEELS